MPSSFFYTSVQSMVPALLRPGRHLQLEMQWHVQMGRFNFEQTDVKFSKSGLLICTRRPSVLHCITHFSSHRRLPDGLHAIPHMREVAACVVCRWAGSVKKKPNFIFFENRPAHLHSLPHNALLLHLQDTVVAWRAIADTLY